MGKPRKPRDLYHELKAKPIALIRELTDDGCKDYELTLNFEHGNYWGTLQKDMRKLAAWLLKAADWLEGREKR